MIKDSKIKHIKKYEIVHGINFRQELDAEAVHQFL